MVAASEYAGEPAGQPDDDEPLELFHTTNAPQTESRKRSRILGQSYAQIQRREAGRSTFEQGDVMKIAGRPYRGLSAKQLAIRPIAQNKWQHSSSFCGACVDGFF